MTKNENSNHLVQLRIDKLEGRKRQVLGAVQIPRSLNQVWQVITNYESFPDFMPVVSKSHLIIMSNGSTYLEQLRTKKFMGISIVARSVFKISESYPHKVSYDLIEGDFQEFSSQWCLESYENIEGYTNVNLSCKILVLPKKIIPVALIEYVLCHDMPASLLAIRKRVEDLF